MDLKNTCLAVPDAPSWCFWQYSAVAARFFKGKYYFDEEPADETIELDDLLDLIIEHNPGSDTWLFVFGQGPVSRNYVKLKGSEISTAAMMRKVTVTRGQFAAGDPRFRKEIELYNLKEISYEQLCEAINKAK